jgi:hypothetical protein
MMICTCLAVLCAHGAWGTGSESTDALAALTASVQALTSDVEVLRAELTSTNNDVDQLQSAVFGEDNAKGSGFEARQGQGFSRLYETPEILGAGDSHVLRMRR